MLRALRGDREVVGRLRGSKESRNGGEQRGIAHAGLVTQVGHEGTQQGMPKRAALGHVKGDRALRRKGVLLRIGASLPMQAAEQQQQRVCVCVCAGVYAGGCHQP